MELAERFIAIRQQTEKLAAPLSEADLTVQAAEFASPGKWHLAHTTWFFEEFILAARPQHPWFDPAFRFLFNSYYDSVGTRQPQARRGLITRPSVREVLDYRRHIDAQMIDALQGGLDPSLLALVELGLHHEQQHQELLLTDALYLLAQNPLHPAYAAAPPAPATALAQPGWVEYQGGLHELGHRGDGFGFDNEFPRHPAYLPHYRLATQLVTNAQWVEFIHDGGYRNPLLWLADGWKACQAEHWEMPLYWEAAGEKTGRQSYAVMTLHGLCELDPHAPVTQVSYFEADAFARWAGKRLPTEFEWERAARMQAVHGNFLESGQLRPLPASADTGQFFGDAWEWTSSPYMPYPGFRKISGAAGEYNGKFMSGQYVLRGGSCLTPRSHMRASYRNFFYPHQRWQFSGLRLAEDAA